MSAYPISKYNFPTPVLSGIGALKRLPELLQGAGVKTPLIITDKVLALLPPIQAVQSVLLEQGMDAKLFDGIFGNPTVSQVMSGTEMARAESIDCIVAVGGGAALDVAKCIAVMMHHPGTLLDYEDGNPNGLPVDKQMPYVVAIPTTAGTGSEVGRSSVISDDTAGGDVKTKRIIFDPRMLPEAVILDAELTTGLPAKITAATGVDALTHCVEGYLAKGSHPMCDGIALEGMRLISTFLETATDGAPGGKSPAAMDDEAYLLARDAMLNASMMGAVAFQKGLGVVHSCAHSLGAVSDIHHGLACAVMLPVCMEFNKQVAAPRLEAMALSVGAEEISADGFIKFCHDFNARLGIPKTLADAGVRIEQLDDLVAQALADGCHGSNPREVSADDFRALFTSAIAGDS